MTPFLCSITLQVDRVYVSSPNVVAVLDHEKKHSFVIRKEGLPDVGKICCPNHLQENKLLTVWQISHCNHHIPVSCVESVGKEIEDYGGLWWWGVQADALCWCGRSGESNHPETRGGVDWEDGTFSCFIHQLQRSSWSPHQHLACSVEVHSFHRAIYSPHKRILDSFCTWDQQVDPSIISYSLIQLAARLVTSNLNNDSSALLHA